MTLEHPNTQQKKNNKLHNAPNKYGYGNMYVLNKYHNYG
jgi:hypothetical protein